MKRTLLVPKTVSFNEKRGKPQHKGTKAFVCHDPKFRFPRGMSSIEKFMLLRRMARKSRFYTRPMSPRAKKIADILSKAGVRTEKVIQDLKTGRVLVQRDGFEFSSEAGLFLFKRNPEMFLNKIAEAVGRMHSAGVKHNHLHLGNIVLTPDGQVEIIDLGKATHTKDFVRGQTKIFVEAFNFSSKLATMCRVIGVAEQFIKNSTIPEELLWQIYLKISSHYSEELRRAIDTPRKKREPRNLPFGF